MEPYRNAAQRLLWERKRIGGNRRKRLELLLRWSVVEVAHRQDYRKRRHSQKGKHRFIDASCWVCYVAKAVCRHHIIQVQHGGGTDDRNVVPLCAGCHAEVHPWMDASEHPLVVEANQWDEGRQF